MDQPGVRWPTTPNIKPAQAAAYEPQVGGWAPLHSRPAAIATGRVPEGGAMQASEPLRIGIVGTGFGQQTARVFQAHPRTTGNRYLRKGPGAHGGGIS